MCLQVSTQCKIQERKFISSVWICLCFRATPRKELFCVSTLQGLVPQKVFSKLRRPTRLTEDQGTHYMSNTLVFSPGAQGRYALYHTYSITSYGYFRREVSQVALSR